MAFSTVAHSILRLAKGVLAVLLGKDEEPLQAVKLTLKKATERTE
jgi:hypothetical protein